MAFLRIVGKAKKKKKNRTITRDYVFVLWTNTWLFLFYCAMIIMVQRFLKSEDFIHGNHVEISCHTLTMFIVGMT